MKPDDIKFFFIDYQIACQNFDKNSIKNSLNKYFTDSTLFHLCHPFGTFRGLENFLSTTLIPLIDSMPDLERRDMIVMAGTTPEGRLWIGTMGNYLGTFLKPFLNIPPTGNLVHMRYHEFFQIEENKIIEMQSIWDLPELMMQANAWPMTPQLGSFICTPSPMTGDGLKIKGDGSKNFELVINMLQDMVLHPSNPDPKIMGLDKYWHPRFNWYGPAGIGTARGIAGFRHWHQIPFLRAMPDRRGGSSNEHLKIEGMQEMQTHWIYEGDYVCETGWPNMRSTISKDGWMGIAPSNQIIEMRSLDFWRIENGLIRENWVLVDLLDVYQQIGVNVFDRIKEFNKARNLGDINISKGLDSIK
jgi:predicted ester cyclase